MKTAFIGGGSYAWMPHLIPSFVMNDCFKGSELFLTDVNEDALSDLERYGNICSAQRPDHNVRISASSNLEEALDGASYVVMAITHGGSRTENADHALARKYGFFNWVGSEVGVAGCSRTLRHVPEAVRIARLMEKHCPDAMFLNVTNPLTAVTRAINRYSSIKAYGFCHGVTNHLPVLFSLFGKDEPITWPLNEEDFAGVDFNVAGIDHCSWLLDLTYNGNDALAIMKGKGLIERARDGLLNVTANDPFAGKERQRLRFILWGVMGYMPAISDTHIADFFGQLVGTEEVRDHYGVRSDYFDKKDENARAYKQRVLDIVEGKKEPELTAGGEIIDTFIAALHGKGALIDVMNAPNEGQVSNLPTGSIVETKCLVDATGVHPIHAGALPKEIENVVRPIALRQELYMEAAMESNIQKLKAALSMDPLVNDFRNMDALCEELFDYNRPFRGE